MDTPCIVCQENCPVSPKAIFTREYFNPVRKYAQLIVKSAKSLEIEFSDDVLTPNQYATGDYYCRERKSQQRYRIVRNTANRLAVSDKLPFESTPEPGDKIEILIKLQRPYVDPKHCIGCGVCEHECPVKGKRAIRVTAENETRSREHQLII
jgi:ferredoxin